MLTCDDVAVEEPWGRSRVETLVGGGRGGGEGMGHCISVVLFSGCGMRMGLHGGLRSNRRGMVLLRLQDPGSDSEL